MQEQQSPSRFVHRRWSNILTYFPSFSLVPIYSNILSGSGYHTGGQTLLLDWDGDTG